MKKNLVICFFVGVCQSVFAQETMPVSEVKIGMTATAKTVFKGAEVEAFDVEIVDVMKNFYPKRDVVMVRLKGEKATFAGPTSGMSGSPVYYDGKLIGALAYSWGSFLKDPIMGVTPIGEMLEIFEKENIRASEVASAANAEIMQRYVNLVMHFEPHDWQAFLPPEPLHNASSNTLPLPIHLSGFSEKIFHSAQSNLSSWGLRAVQGGKASNDTNTDDLIPGAMLAAVIIAGDYDVAATGTITYRKGDKLLAFGHPFFDRGPIEMPLAKASVLTTLASSFSSTKMSLTGEIVGTLWQDRTTGIMGEIGPIPAMTKVKMRHVSEQGVETDFDFAVTKDRSIASLAPLFLRLALINGLESARLGVSLNTLRVTGNAWVSNGDVLPLDNLYPGYQPQGSFSFLNSVLHSTGDVAARMAAISNNPFEKVTFDSVYVEFKSEPGRKTAELEKAWANKRRFKPGDAVDVSYIVKNYHGEKVTRKAKIVIPKHVRDRSLTLVIGGANAMNAFETRLTPNKFKSESFSRLMDVLAQARRNDRLYIQLRASDRGAYVDGSSLPNLPPSVYPVLARTSDSKTSLTRDRVIQEIALPVDAMISGVQLIRLRRE